MALLSINIQALNSQNDYHGSWIIPTAIKYGSNTVNDVEKTYEFVFNQNGIIGENMIFYYNEGGSTGNPDVPVFSAGAYAPNGIYDFSSTGLDFTMKINMILLKKIG